MPCFSCFTWHFHQIAGLSTVLRDGSEACVDVAVSYGTSQKETKEGEVPVFHFVYLDHVPLTVRGCAQSPETLEINFVNGKLLFSVCLHLCTGIGVKLYYLYWYFLSSYILNVRRPPVPQTPPQSGPVSGPLRSELPEVKLQLVSNRKSLQNTHQERSLEYMEPITCVY